MKVIAINGSAQKDANAFCLIREVFKPIESAVAETALRKDGLHENQKRDYIVYLYGCGGLDLYSLRR